MSNQNTSPSSRMIYQTTLDAKKAVLLTFVAFLFTGFQCAIYGMLTVPIALHFGINSNIIIFFDGFSMWGQILAMATGGMIIRAIKGKNLLIVAAILMIVGSIVSIFAPNIYFYTTMAFLCNMAVGYVLVACNYMIIGASQEEGQSEGKLSILNVFFSLGWMISAPIVGVILFKSSWQAVFVIIMILFVSFILFLLTLRVNEITEKALLHKAQERLEKKGHFVNSRLLIAALALLCMVYVEQIMNYYNQPHLHYDLALNIAVIGMIVMTYSMCQLIGRAVFGAFILPKVAVHRYIMVSALLFALVLFVYIRVETTWVVFVLAGVLGLCDSCLYPSILGYGLDQLDHSSAAGTSFMVTIGGIGIPLGTSLCGILGEKLGRLNTMTIGSFLLVVIVILIMMVHQMKVKKI